MTSFPFGIVRICRYQFKCNYLKNEKRFVPFLEFTLNLKHVFPKLQTVNDLVRPLSEKQCFRTPFDSQYVKGSKTPAKSAWQYFYHNSPALWAKLICKISLLVIFDILGAFDNALTGDDKYPLGNCKNLLLSIQMQLSNENYFLRFLCHVWHLHKILNILKKR